MGKAIVREARSGDYDFVKGLMVDTLEPFYGGDHVAHASRIFQTHIEGGKDRIGFFSSLQKMFIAEVDGKACGLLHVVLKRQETCKISPLIVAKEWQGTFGVGKSLLDCAIQFAEQNSCRQIYCTVAEKNRSALKFFLRNNFVIAGRSDSHYKSDIIEIMMYHNLEEIVSEEEFDLDHISVLPLRERHKTQVRKMLLEELKKDFQSIDDPWVNSFFDGHSRRSSGNVQDKFKLIFTAVDRNERVLGVVGATPKKGQPIKLMPFVAVESPAFFAMLADVPSLLKAYGRKVYVHLIPDSEQTQYLQRSGWSLDGLMPDAYRVGRVTQQWSKQIDGTDFMRNLRLKQRYLDAMRRGEKTLEVRVGYESVKKIKIGDQINFLSRDESVVRNIKDIRIYQTFTDMFQFEEHSLIVPGVSKIEAENLLREIYPENKEALGIYVLEVS